MTKMARRMWSAILKRPMACLAANINLAKPLERLLASRIHQNDWYELRQELLRTQAYLASHPLRGLMGARVDII